jgi:DNA-binding NarL/FixJ family response regulator
VTENGRARVVVADDHPAVLATITSILTPAFDVVAAAANGAGAIDATAQLHPDVVVLDIEMPGLDGFQTAARIRASGSGARVVFLSNHTGDDFVLAGISRGGSAFVPKVRMDRDLVDAIDLALSGRSFVPAASVLPRWSRPPGRQHDLQLYASDAFLIDAVMAFYETALEVGDSIIAIATPPHLEALDQQFRRRGFDPDALVASGRYSISDSTAALESILRDGMPDRERFAAEIEPLLARALPAATSAPPHVSVYGEIAPLLCARGEFEAMIRLEQIADEFAASHPMSVLCGYSVECLGSDSSRIAADVCAEHSTIVPPHPRH